MTDFFFGSIIAMTDLLRINSCLSKLYRRALSVLASQVIRLLVPLLRGLQPAIHLQVVQVRMVGLIILVLVWGSADMRGKWLVRRKLDYRIQEEEKGRILKTTVHYRSPCFPDQTLPSSKPGEAEFLFPHFKPRDFSLVM